MRSVRCAALLSLASASFACSKTGHVEARPTKTPAQPIALTSSAARTLTAAPSMRPAIGWYDATTLLDSVRDSQRATLGAISDLPFYDLDLALDDGDGSFTLGEDVYFTNHESAALSDVVLRVYANSASSGTDDKKDKPALVSFVSGACAGVACIVGAEGKSAIRVTPSAPIAPGGRLVIHVELKGALEEIDSSRTNLLSQSIEQVGMLGGGASFGDFGILAHGDGICSMGNFYAVIGRRENAAWQVEDASTMGDLGSDEMSHVRAKITVDDDVKVASSGVAIKDAPASSGKHTVEISATMVRDFALLASRDFQVSTKRVGETDVRSFYLGKEKDKGEAVLDAAAWAMGGYTKRFGEYPYKELDVVEAPLVGGVGGVEFTGLVTIASMFYRPMIGGGLLGGLLKGLMGSDGEELAGGVFGSMLEFVTAHEVAHQWWHGIVGSDSRLHPYLDEGLAQWTAMLYLEDRYDAARAEKDAAMNVAMNYKAMRMMGSEDAAVDRAAADFKGAMDYAGLIYGKGPYVWRAMRKELGDAVFFDAVRAYVAKNRLKIASPRALVEELAATNGGKSADKVHALATHWLDEAHGDDDLGKGSLMDLLGPGLDGKGGSSELKSLMDQLLNGTGDEGDD